MNKLLNCSPFMKIPLDWFSKKDEIDEVGRLLFHEINFLEDTSKEDPEYMKRADIPIKLHQAKLILSILQKIYKRIK